MGKSQQRKGRNGEMELSALLNSFGYSTHIGRALNFGTEPDISGLDGIHIECKRNEHLNIYDALMQSIRDSERFKDGVPVVIHRKNRHGWIVTMQLEDWIKMYQESK